MCRKTARLQRHTPLFDTVAFRRRGDFASCLARALGESEDFKALSYCANKKVDCMAVLCAFGTASK